MKDVKGIHVRTSRLLSIAIMGFFGKAGENRLNCSKWIKSIAIGLAQYPNDLACVPQSGSVATLTLSLLTLRSLSGFDSGTSQRSLYYEISGSPEFVVNAIVGELHEYIAGMNPSSQSEDCLINRRENTFYNKIAKLREIFIAKGM